MTQSESPTPNSRDRLRAPLGRRWALSCIQLADQGVFFASLYAATVAVAWREEAVPGELLDARIHVENYVFAVGFAVVWHVTYALHMLYDYNATYFQEGKLTALVRATMTGTLLLAAAAALFDYGIVTPLFLTAFFIAATVLSISVRLVLNAVVLRTRLATVHAKQVLIVGTNRRARVLAERYQRRPEMGYHVLGFVDSKWPSAEAEALAPAPLLASFDALATYLRDHVVDEVIICLPVKSQYTTIARIVDTCEEQGVPLSISTKLFNIQNPRVRQKYFSSSLVLLISSSILDEREMVLKRLIDVVGSLALLVVLSPLLFLVALLVKATSRGPAIFVQERVGLNKRVFRLYKFRTMVADAEARLAALEHLNEAEGGHFKIKDDPRLTTVGRWLRRTSIDELPQLYNVLKGEMSLVGPRPLPLRDVDNIVTDWPRRRFGIRPGITCLWQIAGRADQSISFDQWMALDMAYIDQWSLLLDFKILFWTIPAVLRGKGAY